MAIHDQGFFFLIIFTYLYILFLNISSILPVIHQVRDIIDQYYHCYCQYIIAKPCTFCLLNSLLFSYQFVSNILSLIVKYRRGANPRKDSNFLDCVLRIHNTIHIHNICRENLQTEHDLSSSAFCCEASVLIILPQSHLNTKHSK